MQLTNGADRVLFRFNCTRYLTFRFSVGTRKGQHQLCSWELKWKITDVADKISSASNLNQLNSLFLRHRPFLQLLEEQRAFAGGVSDEVAIVSKCRSLAKMQRSRTAYRLPLPATPDVRYPKPWPNISNRMMRHVGPTTVSSTHQILTIQHFPNQTSIYTPTAAYVTHLYGTSPRHVSTHHYFVKLVKNGYGYCTTGNRVSTISQEYLLEFTSEYDISEDLHPELPGPGEMIVDFPEGKVGVYTKFFEFANFRLPLSQFLFDIIGHYQIHLSQLSVIGAAKDESSDPNSGIFGYSSIPFLYQVNLFETLHKEQNTVSLTVRADPTIGLRRESKNVTFRE
nr:hypothetical protein [Tanacetum cinerariifolium]